MAEPLEAVSPVTVWGLRRGAEYGGVGAIELREDAVLLDAGGAGAPPVPGVHGGRVVLPLAALEGVKFASAEVGTAGLLTLFVQGGDMYEVSGAARLAGVARHIGRRVCVLPEATLRLHGLGSHRGRPGSDHDRFFAPLLRARRRAERAGAPEQQMAAFDAAAMAQEYRRLFADLAIERFPHQAPERRALEAELLDLAEALLASLVALGTAAAAAREAPEDARFARWREWAAAVGAAFEQADRCWLAALPPLSDSRGRQGRFWRGLLRRLGGRGAEGTLALCAALGAAAARPAVAQHVVLRLPTVPAESLLARGFDVVERRADGVLIVAGPDDRARLAALGWTTIDVDTPSGRRLARAAQANAPAGAVTPVVYRPYDDPARGVRFFIDSLAAANPRVHALSIGTTFEGRPIVGVKIGPGDDRPSRPNALFMAAYHAREWASAETALRLIRCLARRPGAPAGADCPGVDPRRVDSLVADRDVWVIPVVNPDGYQYTFAGDATRLWRRNRRPMANNTVGVDLNRNHSARWAYDEIGSSGTPGSEVYRGPSPASEAEVRAVEAFHAAHPPVVSVSWHTYSGLVLYPPGFRSGLLPQDLGVYRALAGTDVRPAVRDHLPDTPMDYYHPGPGWHLYPTNGEYGDYASASWGTLAFTPELTSGYENGVYYGFEFPDDETRLQQLFADNLPFALDVLESAADPRGYRSPSTGLRNEVIALESVAPVVRVRVPAGSPPAVTVRAADGSVTQSLPLTADDSTDPGVFTKRYYSAPLARPAEVIVRSGARAARFTVLASTGAEGTAEDAAWQASGFVPVQDARAVAGSSVWAGAPRAALRSPVVHVPQGTDTLSVLFWSQQNTFLISPDQTGEVRVSLDSGRTFAVAGLVAGSAPIFYPEAVAVPGVAGHFVQVEISPRQFSWRLDEVALVGHASSAAAGATDITDGAIAFSQNPLRVGGWVYVTVPASLLGGEVLAYDFAGRVVWRTRITGDTPGRDPNTMVVGWNVESGAVANGAYVIVARAAGGRGARRTLFVAR